MQVKSVSVLLIDAGNTRYEWRLLRDNLFEGAAFYHEPLPELVGVERVIVASVKENGPFKQALNKKWSDTVTWLEHPIVDYPRFMHCYKNPQRMGVDRWLAMIGARKYNDGNVLVVDAGTALTIDALNANNQHLGGYIVPGLLLAEQALFQQADKVTPYQDEHKLEGIGLGQDTLSCVAQGLQRQRLAFVESVWKEYPAYKLLITGGDGLGLAKQTETPYYQNLVLDGMELLCAGYL